MQVPPLSRLFRQTVSTLKFKVIALSVLTAMTAAVGAVQIALDATILDFEKSVLASQAVDAERNAALLGDKLGMLQSALRAVQQATPAGAWHDQASMTRYLVDKPALHTLFDVVVAVDPHGEQIVRLERGTPRGHLHNLAREEYFSRVLRGDQPVVSNPVISPVLQEPVVAILQPAVHPDGEHEGVLIGTLKLQSAELFSLTARAAARGTQEIVVDRRGIVLSHPDASQIMRDAAATPGLADVVEDWLANGAPIDTVASAYRLGGHFVALAGIPGSDWALLRSTDEKVALEAVELARQRGWKISTVAGVLAGVLAGILVWVASMPISQLRREIERLKAQPDAVAQWPDEGGEIGRLVDAFAELITDRQQQDAKNRVLLRELDAVMNHAQVGIALSKGGVLQLANAQLGAILRRPPALIVGSTPRMLHASTEQFERASAVMQEALGRQGCYDAEIELLRGDGTPFWCRLHGRAIDPLDRAAGVIWTFQDVTEDRGQRDRLSWAAAHDPLTGLSNRTGFQAALASACSAEGHAPFAALCIDLDRFKQVNDTGGHAAGDAMLKAVAAILAGRVRQTDVVARLGGDEFAVLLNNCSAARATAIGQKIVEAVDQHVMRWEGAGFSVGASIGVASARGGGVVPETILRAADKACYAAKRAGRNCLVVADAPAMAVSDALV